MSRHSNTVMCFKGVLIRNTYKSGLNKFPFFFFTFANAESLKKQTRFFPLNFGGTDMICKTSSTGLERPSYMKSRRIKFFLALNTLEYSTIQHTNRFVPNLPTHSMYPFLHHHQLNHYYTAYTYKYDNGFPTQLSAVDLQTTHSSSL